MTKAAKRPLINEALRLARLYWGFNQAEMAERLGVSQSVVSEVESASKSVSMDLLERYSDALKVKMSNLVFFAEELESIPNPSRGKTIVAKRVLEFLDRIAPNDKADA